MTEFTLPSCPTCGGEMVMAKGSELPVPDDFELTTCRECGEELAVPEIDTRLDAILAKELAARVGL